jgi:hypothetical protein
MRTKLLRIALTFLLTAGSAAGEWKAPARIDSQKTIQASQEVLARPQLELEVEESIFRINALDLDWDIAGEVFTPADRSRIQAGPDGRKIGLFLLHGGTGDHRTQRRFARLLAERYGFKVVTMTYPGRLNLLDENRDWPGDSLRPDGTVRTPLWTRETLITDDQYEVVEDREHPGRYARWGTLILACANEGTEFYDRMASWPVAFEEGARAMMQRHLPAGEFSIYIHGHSTGGPFAHMLSQRVDNIAGVLAMESSPFGYIAAARMGGAVWDLPFECLRIRNWCGAAKYVGPPALPLEGADALRRLPELMEKVFERWNRGLHYPLFKAENIIHFNALGPLEDAARATAARIGASPAETEELVARYLGYTRELTGPGVKPVPPILISATSASSSYTEKIVNETVLPMLAAIEPPPRVAVSRFEGGTHSFGRPEEALPMGHYPAVAKLWHDAIQGGFFLAGSQP